MPIQIVDLVSSPELRPSRPVVSAPIKIAKTKPAIPDAAKPLNSKTQVDTPDDWLSLSSDDDGFSLVKPLTSNRPNTSAATKPNILKSPKTSKAGVIERDGFIFLEEDFDSSAHMDGSMLELPPAKKQRLSPPPKIAPSKGTLARRSASNIETSNKSAASGPALKRSKTTFDDDIIFTSSPDPFLEAAKRRKQKRKENQELEDFDDISGLEPPRAAKNRLVEVDVSSDEDFPDIDAIPSRPAPSARSKSPITKSPISKSPKRKASGTALAQYNKERADQKKADEKAVKAKAKEQAKKDKDAEKEAEKERKVQEREQKKRDKEVANELAKVNVSRNDKKLSSPEMIVDMSSGLDLAMVESVWKFLGPLDVEHSTWDDTSPIVKWRRKVTAVYDEEKGHWEPINPHIKGENHILYLMTAKEFVERALGDEGADIDIHVLKLKAKFDACEIIYLVEGLTTWMKKNANLKNKQFIEGVRSQMAQEAPTASQRKKKEAEYVDEDIIEDALLRLQIQHKALIHHTKSKIESAQWIVNFTQHISTIPYKKQKDLLDTAFCMDSGQVKSGEDASDTYCKMLQEIIRITAPVAYGIMAEYPTVQKLVRGLEEHGALALEDCRKMANRDGAFTDKRVGPAISKRVHSVFTGRDPKSFDV
ncbi:Crossover junction endonuclease eme1 [Lachnellula suecica]|uniref:Crossover junction endonuclease eme1 n=1 Tax=Lachnellula suecica TaxID=602035 RepID=A0A8T9C1Y3_9HELO|nr:Crossover junction endonuclease eme1 [Lachnellula suecica]